MYKYIHNCYKKLYKSDFFTNVNKNICKLLLKHIYISSKKNISEELKQYRFLHERELQVNIQKSNLNAQNVSFSGHNKKLDKTGYEINNFYYLYDPKKYDCEVELYNIKKDNKGNLSIAENKEPAAVLPLVDGFVSADISEIPQLNSPEGFAYRFKLTDKSTNEHSYAFDNGTVIGIFDETRTDNKYNVILNNRAIINKNGAMQLIMPDEYYPGVEGKSGSAKINESLRAKALSNVRTHANKLGGNFYGIIYRLPELEKEGVKRIVGMPFTRDTISSHLYWTENAYQVAPTLGTEEDFKTLQRELFKHDMNWIADAALVNEGFGGIHLSELLRKGSDSFSKNMFRAEEKISLGILPDKCDYTRMKIINAPFLVDEKGAYKSENSEYNPAKPTYIQFYDERLASEEQKKSDSPFRMSTYDNKNTDNIYDITKHDDAVYPFAIEVNPDELKRNVRNIAVKEGVVDLTKTETIKKVSDFTNFNVVNKSEAGGLELWDGNVDIAKLNFYRNSKDDARFTKLPENIKEEAIADFDRGALAVRDYAVNSGKYWTKLTADTQFEYVSKVIGEAVKTPEGYMNTIEKLVKSGDLPSSVLKNVDEEIIENVLNDNYHLRRLDDADMRVEINPEYFDGNDYNVSDYILRQSMDVPLETLPFATNLLGIMTSPYIAKKANTDDEIGISRYDLYKAGNPELPEKYSKVYNQMEALYQEDIVPVIYSLIEDIPGISQEGKVTEYGKYVLSEITPELTKYILVKALAPKAPVRLTEDGHLDFTNINPEDITMQSLGIPYSGKTLEEESQAVVNILRKGISKIPESSLSVIKSKIENRFKDRSLSDFKIAEMIIDRTEAGLGWRIDAAKDIGSIDSFRSDADSMTEIWNNVIAFWKKYNQSVLQINPHSYTTAEITDLADLFRAESSTIFENDGDAERKFLEETGITSIANYNYFFSLLPELFAEYGFENGNPSWRFEQSKNFSLREKLDKGWTGNPGFLFQSPEDGVINSYTFVGNHDKPRVLHCLALNMRLFNSDFSSDDDKKAADECILKNENEVIDYDTLSPMAIAMGTRLNEAIKSVISDETTINALKKSISNLARGIHKGKEFDAAAFGTRPFEIAIKTVFDEAEYNGSKIPNRDELEAKILENILTPAFDRFYSIYKLLITLPGSPTDFAGDRVASTGFETKAKNYHQQNRNVIHWEWLNDNRYKFVKQFYDKMNEIANLRSRPELSALNNGTTVSIPIEVESKDEKGIAQTSLSEKVQSMLRYNNEGSVVLTLHDATGADVDNKDPNSLSLTKKLNRKETRISTMQGNIYGKIILDPEIANAKQGLKHGLEIGSKFKNARNEDNSTYEIAKFEKKGKLYYYLRRRDAKGQEIPVVIKPEDLNTLILYKVK